MGSLLMAGHLHSPWARPWHQPQDSPPCPSVPEKGECGGTGPQAAACAPAPVTEQHPGTSLERGSRPCASRVSEENSGTHSWHRENLLWRAQVCSTETAPAENRSLSKCHWAEGRILCLGISPERKMIGPGRGLGSFKNPACRIIRHKTSTIHPFPYSASRVREGGEWREQRREEGGRALC